MRKNTLKTFCLKSLNLILNMIIVIGALYSLFMMIIQFIPAEYAQVVYDWLQVNVATLVPATISTSVTTVVLFLAKFGHTAIKVLIKNSETVQEAFRKKLQDELNVQIKDVELRETATIKLLNKALAKIDATEQLLIRANKYDELVAEKNLSSAIIPEEYKKEILAWKNDVSQSVKESKKLYKETEYVTEKRTDTKTINETAEEERRVI